jgi:hypothetical protein
VTIFSGVQALVNGILIDCAIVISTEGRNPDSLICQRWSQTRISRCVEMTTDKRFPGTDTGAGDGALRQGKQKPADRRVSGLGSGELSG